MLSPNVGTRLVISWVFKDGWYDVGHKPVKSAEDMLSILIEEFKTNFIGKDPSGDHNLIILNCRNIYEYRRVLEPLTKGIMANRINWALKGVTFTREDINKFLDACVIAHFVMGANLVYQMENDQDVRTILGDMNTDELLSCTNLFCDVGLSLSVYFEKNLEPTTQDIQQYNHAMKKGKEEAVKAAALGNTSSEEITNIINKHLGACSLVRKSDEMKERLLGDVQTFLYNKKNWEEISHERANVVASADIFKQYQALKDKALLLKQKREYMEMEKTLSKCLELLEGTGELGKHTLFDTYIELGKSQMHRKKYVSAQRNATAAKKIRREAPSPHRMMGECQLGRGAEAITKGDYDKVETFFNKAYDCFAKSQELAEGVALEEAKENEIESATAISFFGDWIKWEAKKEPKAAKLLKENNAFKAIENMRKTLVVKHKIEVDAKISQEIYRTETDKNFEKARNFALQAANLVLGNKPEPAMALYERARKFDDLTAFRAISQQAKNHRTHGEIEKARDLYSWLAKLDKNEADLQYINVARCCLQLGDRVMAMQRLQDALHANENVIQEAIELDPDFKRSDVMSLYLHSIKK